MLTFSNNSFGLFSKHSERSSKCRRIESGG